MVVLPYLLKIQELGMPLQKARVTDQLRFRVMASFGTKVRVRVTLLVVLLVIVRAGMTVSIGFGQGLELETDFELVGLELRAFSVVGFGSCYYAHARAPSSNK